MPLSNRSESDHRLVTFSELTLARLKRDGRASAAKIAGLETDITRASRDILSEWFDQADRLAAARKNHGLSGAAFREFAKSIGVGGSDAFKLERLSGQREVVFAACEAEASDTDEPYRWPGWRRALEMTAVPEKARGGSWNMATRSGFVPKNDTDRTMPDDEWPDGDEWETPDHLFRFLDRHYHFTVDVAANSKTRKVRKFYDIARDGLKQDWAGEVVFMNPPYSESGKWTKKAQEAAQHGAIVVALLPNRSATAWYREHLAPSALIVLLHGKVPFFHRGVGRGEITMSGAPFASILAIWPASAGKRILKFTQPTSTVIMKMPSL